MIYDTELISETIKNGAGKGLTERQFLEREISDWKISKKRKNQITGEKYYIGEHDILERERTVIGAGGVVQKVSNLPNNKILDNQYSKLVDQKVNYLLSKPLTLEVDSEQYLKELGMIINNKFLRTLKSIGEDSLNNGIAWLYPYYNEQSKFCFKKFEATEILPFWKDAAHTELESFVRLFAVQAYEGDKKVIIEKVEYYSTAGIKKYILKSGKLIDDVENPHSTHIVTIDQEGKEIGLNWTKTPLVALKYNNKETPLITRVKSLQDGINIILSDFTNNMQEDARNTIIVLQNYDGTNLGEFRYNLAQYGAVKVKTVDGAVGDVKTLTVEVNSENYKAILEIFKKALIENGRGLDSKDDRLAGNPNQMNIQSMYSDIDLDANGMETEYQAALEELLWFVNIHLTNTGKGDFENENVNIIFNRDILINEADSITNCKDSVGIGIISNKSITAKHPWVSDVAEELERIKKEKEEQMSEMDNYKKTFPDVNFGGGGANEA
ncbi:MAG: phage portal protein [Alkaliphilus sp.]